jgi:hypothetical protein
MSFFQERHPSPGKTILADRHITRSLAVRAGHLSRVYELSVLSRDNSAIIKTNLWKVKGAV